MAFHELSSPQQIHCFPQKVTSSPGERHSWRPTPSPGCSSYSHTSKDSQEHRDKAMSMDPSRPMVAECDDPWHAQWGQLLGWLNGLEAESADEGGSEGTQVQVSVMFMGLTHIGDHQSIRIM